VPSKGFQACFSSATSDEITWKKPRTVLVVIAWSIISASLMLNLFLSRSKMVGFTFWSISTALPITLLFFISIFAGMLLEDIKSIILGVFEALALTILLTYVGMALPALLGDAPSVLVNAVYGGAMYEIFVMFFPLIPLSFFVGAAIGGFVKDWLF